MFNQGNFIDKEYDGIILKLPSFFIDVNELQPIIDNLRQEIESANKSKYMPDVLNSVFELNNYKSKKEFCEKQKKEQEIEDKRRSEYYNKRINLEVIDAFYKQKKETFMNGWLDCASDLPDFKFIDFTQNNSQGYSKAKLDIFKSQVKSLTESQLSMFFNINFPILYQRLLEGDIDGHKYCIPYVDSIFVDNSMYLSIYYDILHVRYYSKNMSYFELPVYYNNNNSSFYVRSPRKSMPNIDLSKYNFNGKQFILKQQ